MPGAVNSDIAGTTSACAENTYLGWGSLCVRWNYLRVRGEYHDKPAGPQASAELPPRARRIPSPHQFRVPRRGTTSACAENTRAATSQTYRTGNYLRVRGEYKRRAQAEYVKAELPPRARRIRSRRSSSVVTRGTTSACAENTKNHETPRHQARNYLRVRGEYPTRHAMLHA